MTLVVLLSELCNKKGVLTQRSQRFRKEHRGLFGENWKLELNEQKFGKISSIKADTFFGYAFCGVGGEPFRAKE